MLNKKKVYSIQEFIQYLDEKNIKKTDKQVGILLKDRKFKPILVAVTGNLLHYSVALADASSATGKISVAGNTIFGICKEAAFWICLIMCAIEIVKALMNGDTKSVSKVIAKYIVAYGAIYLLPWSFNLIKDIFG
ncbi:hypothetical protein [Clostridium sp. UBA3061]|uniref:hypothetical protein n=1 Tax=Clostridium sp. UBA3061 TaxID=1946353 RepID=UPI003217ADD3